MRLPAGSKHILRKFCSRTGFISTRRWVSTTQRAVFVRGKMEAAQGSLGAVVLRRARAALRPRGEEVSGSPEEEDSPPRSFLRSALGTPRLGLCGEQGCPRPAHGLLCAEPSRLRYVYPEFYPHVCCDELLAARPQANTKLTAASRHTQIVWQDVICILLVAV